MKAGYKSTEFWVTLATMGTAVVGGMPLWAAPVVAVIYTIARAIVKYADSQKG